MHTAAKIGLSVVVLALVAGLAVHRLSEPTPDPVVAAPPMPSDAAAARPETAQRTRHAAAPTVRSAAGGIDGTVTADGAPADARVSARRMGEARDDLTWNHLRVRTLARPPAAAADAEGSTDASGSFSLDGLGVGVHRVTASFADGRRATGLVDLTPEAPRARLDLSAPMGGIALRGRAVRADGTPFSGWIRVHQTIIEDALWARTGARGEFAFAGLGPLKTWVRATDQGGTSSASVTLQLPLDEELMITVDAGAGPRRGRVVADADGTPVVGATVRVRSGDVRRVQFEAELTSGDDGGFEGCWSGRARLVVTADGFAKTVVSDDGTADEVVVPMARSSTVVGSVVREDERTPLAGVVVRARPAGDKNSANEAAVRSGADGAFRIADVAPGEIDVFVRGGGWVSPGLAATRRGGFDPLAVRVEPGATVTLDLQAIAAARATGHVVDAAGAPAADVRVGGVPSAYFDGPGWESASTRADADGAFVLEDLLPGLDHTFNVFPWGGRVVANVGPLRTESGKTLDVDFRLDPQRRLTVTVLERDTDTPIAGAIVSIGREGQRARGNWATDAAGNVEIESLPGGSIAVHATAAGHVESTPDVVAEEIDATRLRATVRLAPAQVLAGRVSAPDGVTVAGVLVSATTDPQFTARGATVRANAYAAEDGTFRFDTLPDGAYVVTAWSPGDGGWRASAKAHSGDADVVLALERAAPDGDTLLVRVVDDDGRPVADAAVVALRVWDGRPMYGTGARGRQAVRVGSPIAVRDGTATLTLSSLPSAENWVEVCRARSGGGDSSAGAVATRVPDPVPKDMEVRLPSARRIRGRVLGPGGEGVAGVRITAHPVSGPAFAWYLDRSQTEHATATTDGDGAFDLGGLGAFTYRVTFSALPDFAPPDPRVVEAGTSGVDVWLSRGFEATVTVLDPDGNPLAGCGVTATTIRDPKSPVPSLSTWVIAITTDAGAAKIPPLSASSRYDLSVSPPRGRDDLESARVASWSPADTTIRLTRGVAVAGVVRDTSGRPLARATVSFRSDAGPTGRTLTADDGSFRIAHLAAGDVLSLRAVAEGDVDRDDTGLVGAVRANAGAAGVVIVVDPAATLRVRVVGLPAGATATYALQSTPAVAGRSRPDAAVPADGRIRLAGLDPTARHRIFVGPTEDGLYALSDDLGVGAGETAIHVERGAPLAGRVELPDGVAGEEVALWAFGDGWTAKGSVGADGRFRFPGLPPRVSQLDALVFRGGRVLFRATLPAPSGTAVVVNLTSGSGN